MNGTSKLENKVESPTTTYKSIPEKEMEDETVIRSKAGSKSKNKETDGADEKMLPKEDSKVSPNSEISLKDVRIVMGEKNGDAKLDIVEPKNTFGGMTKEELMKYANDPFWVRLRWFLFITFWLLWAAMLIGAIMIIYAAPKCDPPPPRTWWQEGPLAEVKSDIKSEELKSVNKNIKGLILTWTEDAYKPFDESHDIIKLIKQSKELGTKIIIDLDPSTSQVWFEESEKNSTFKDYYIWQPPKYKNNSQLAPTNWLSKNNDSSWIFSKDRKEYYYAPLKLPHLNFRNELVIKEFAEVIKKFISHGVAGIRIRNAPILLVDPQFEDENLFSNKAGVAVGEPGFFLPTKTLHWKDLGKLLLNWKEVVKNKTEDGLLMVAEELSKVKSYQVNDTVVVDLPLMTNVFASTNVTAIVSRLNQTFKYDNIKWPLWKETSSPLPPDVVSIVTSLLPGASLVDYNATIEPQLLKIRESPSIMRGLCDMHSIINNTVFAFVREIAGNPGVLVALNTADERITLNIRRDVPSLSDLEEVTIQYYSKNYNETDYKDINAKKDSTNIPLSPKSVLVLQYVPKKKD